jgi:hypothetical protein
MLFTNKNPITPELRYLTAKMAALLPFGKVADFLGELLPLSAQATASTVRNRTMKVGRRLQKAAEVLAVASSTEACKELVVGFDGGYVRNRHPRPERNFEVVAGKALNGEGHATPFAFVRSGGCDAMSAVGRALRQCGTAGTTSVTVLTDGDAGLRAIQRHVAPLAEHVLDWFHVAMRFTNLQQLAKGVMDGGICRHARHTRRRIPSLAQRLSANRRPAKTRSLSMTTPQLCTLSHTRMISTGKRRRLNMDRAPRSEAPDYAKPVNSTVPISDERPQEPLLSSWLQRRS